MSDKPEPLKISEIIQHLQSIQEQHGDLYVAQCLESSKFAWRVTQPIVHSTRRLAFLQPQAAEPSQVPDKICTL
jgi:hypothetical protein